MNKPFAFRTLAAAVSLALAHNAFAAGAPKPATQVRADIPTQYKWDFSPIYPSWDAWEAGMKETEAKMDTFAAMKGTLPRDELALLGSDIECIEAVAIHVPGLNAERHLVIMKATT